MGEFNYRKFLTENKLTYASREVASSNLNEDLNSLNLHELTEEEIAYGYSIVKELNLNLDGDLNEGLKDFVEKVKTKLKGLKPNEQLLSILFAKIKKFLPSGVKLKAVAKDLMKASEEIEGKVTKEKLLQWVDKNSTKSESQQLNELALMPDWVRQLGSGALLTLLLAVNVYKGIPNNDDASDSALQNTNDVEQVMDTDSTSTPQNAVEFEDVADDLGTSDEVQDAIGDDTTDQTVTSDGVDVTFDTGQYETDIDKAAEQGAAEIIKNNPNLKSATLKYSSNISNTPGAQDDNPDGPDKTGLGEKRLDTAKKIALKIQKILQDKYPDAQIDLEDGGTNVSDVESQGEVDSGSDEAKSQQTSSVKLTDVQDGDKTPEPTPEDPTPDSDVKPMTPKEVIAFYSKKPDLDSNKYMVVGFHIVPRIIGNGKVINNPDFERVFKHIVVNEKGETFNEEFIKRRINPGGSLRKKLEKAKGSEKEEIEDAIKTLQFIKTTAKKGNKRIESWIKRLDPDIKLGERGAFRYQFEPGVKNQGRNATGRTAPGPRTTGTPVNLGDRKPGDLMQEHISEFRSIYNESISLLLEFNSNSLPGYNEDSAKSNLGLLTQLYVGTWGERKDGSIVEFDNEHLEDKYKSSVDSFYKTYPTVANKVRQFTKKKKSGEKDKAKDQKDKKSDSESTPTTSSPEQGQSGPPPLPVKKPGEQVKATKVEPKTGDAKPGEEVKATKIDAPKGDYFQKGFAGDIPNIKDKKGGKGKPTSAVDFNAKDKSRTPQSTKALEKMGAKKDLTTALSRIDNRPELEGLIKSMITYISLDDDDKVLALKTAKTRFTPLEDQPKYTSTSTSGAKVNYNLKEHIIRLIGIISEAEEKQRPDVEKSIKILDKYADLKSLLDRLSSKEMAIEFVLGVMKFVGDNLKAKSSDMKTALSNVTRDLEKEPKKSSNKVKPEDVKGIANQLKAETLIRKKIKSLIKEQVRKILKEDTVENPDPKDLIPARVKSNGKDALALTRPDGAPYAIAHPDISSLSKMFLNGKQDDTALCGWVQKKIKEPDFIEDLMENKLSLNEASEIDPKTIKKLNNCPLK